MASTILVIEDEANVRRLIRIALQRDGFVVEEAGDGDAGMELFSRAQPDLVLLDLMLPHKDGWQVCKWIRSKDSTPIIMLTARADEIDRVVGLEMGADDYVVKPFSPRELVARVRAVLRRGKLDRSPRTLRHAQLVIHPDERTVTLCNERIKLTPKEFDLLLLLASWPSKVWERSHLVQHVWGPDFWGDERTVDVHVTRIREKLGQVDDGHHYIQTVWGLGYKFEVSKQ